MKTIKCMWDKFRKVMAPEEAPEEQKRVIKGAFYSGASAVIFLMTDLVSNGASEKEGANFIQGLVDECHEYRESLKR